MCLRKDGSQNCAANANSLALIMDSTPDPVNSAHSVHRPVLQRLSAIWWGLGARLLFALGMIILLWATIAWAVR